MSRLILASGSRYRARELARLRLAFEAVPADVDEAPRAGEPPSALAPRLARAKAEAVARRFPQAVIIGSDQVAALDGRAIGKPGSVPAACAQLQAASGRDVRFFTALCVLAPGTPAPQEHLDVTTVRFRALDAAAIARYVDSEQPLDCAGSFKCEGLGISLFESIETRDPSALIGLPLIALAAMLRARGWSLP